MIEEIASVQQMSSHEPLLLPASTTMAIAGPMEQVADGPERVTRHRLAEMLDAVRACSGSIGNAALRKQLGWTDDLYWRARGRLIEDGLLATGRGRGGSVMLAKPAVQSKVQEAPLYDPIAQQIASGWLKSRDYEDAVVEITARKGRASTGGIWTRPDIAIYGKRTFEFRPEKQFDIITFEVKTGDCVDVQAVYEAVSHQKSASYSYVLFNTGERGFSQSAEWRRVLDACNEHGVGLILAEEISQFDSWSEYVEARRSAAEVRCMNSFVSSVFSPESKQKIKCMLR